MKRKLKSIINTKRLRLSLFKSNKYLNVQLINDVERTVLFHVSTKVFNSNLTRLNVDDFSSLILKNIVKLNLLNSDFVFDKGNSSYKGNIILLCNNLRKNKVKF